MGGSLVQTFEYLMGMGNKNTFPFWIMVVCVLDGLRGWYSSYFYQSIDWSCYSLDGQRLLSGDFDYQNYLCEFGYMYYPAGFAYIYAFFQFITEGNVEIMIWIHIAVSIILTYFTLKLFSPYMKLNHRLIFFLLPLLAQNYYRAAISRVTNDLHLTLCIVLMLHAVTKKKFFWSSLLFSFGVSYKMNTLFFGPSLLFVYLHSMPFMSVVIHFFFMGLFQLLIPLPFLITAPWSYIKLAFNFGRDFEHRVNMAWGFLGDEMRHNKIFYTGLLCCQIYFLIIFFILMHRVFIKKKKQWKQEENISATRTKTVQIVDSWYNFKDESELILFTFLVPNFICYTFSRGIHIQFLLWISFSLPYLFTKGSGMGWKIATLSYIIIDWCHSWVTNVIQISFLKEVLQLIFLGNIKKALGIIQTNLFTQLHSIPLEEVFHSTVPPVKILGGYFPYGFSVEVIPASFVLFTLEFIVLHRLFYRCTKNL